MLPKIILQMSFLIVLQFPSLLFAVESCYDLGYRYGFCSGKSFLGLQCKSENDFIMPSKCRGKSNTQEGIKAGLRAAKSGENTFRISPSGQVTRNKPTSKYIDKSNHTKGIQRVNAIISRMEKYKKEKSID